MGTFWIFCYLFKRKTSLTIKLHGKYTPVSLPSTRRIILTERQRLSIIITHFVNKIGHGNHIPALKLSVIGEKRTQSKWSGEFPILTSINCLITKLFLYPKQLQELRRNSLAQWGKKGKIRECNKHKTELPTELKINATKAKLSLPNLFCHYQDTCLPKRNWKSI